MRTLILIILMNTIWGCKQPQKNENQNVQEKERWFFWSVDWHPNRDEFVVGGSNDTFFKLFSATDYKEIKSYPFKGTITKTKWHPTQHDKLAISVQDRKSKPTIFDLNNNERIELDTITIDGARAIGWNHSGDLLAVGDYEGYLTIFNEEGKLLKRVDTNEKSIIGLDWHPTENLIAAVGEKITLYHYELDSLKQFSDRDEVVEVLMLCVAWHPSGVFFVTGDYGIQNQYPPLLQYWTYHGERIKKIVESKAEFRNMAWSSDGALLATASEKVRLWNKDGDLVAEETSKNLLWGIDWNQDASQLVATDVEGKIIFWDRNLHRITELEYGEDYLQKSDNRPD